MIRAVCALLLLAGCMATPPQMGVHLNTRTGHVSPSIATSVGAVRLAANGSGGSVGTRLGPVGVSAGF